MQKNKPITTAVAVTAALAFAQGAAAVGLPDVPNAHTGKQLGSTDSFTTALKGGTMDLMMRLRYEDVNDDLPAGHPNQPGDDAELLSIRSALGYSTARWNGFYARLEAENVTRIGDDKAFNVDDDLTFPPGPAGSISAEGHALIPDPEATEINEAYIGYRGADEANFLGQTTVKVGRQTILYDNHRWVGNIVWRQNHQSFDAIRIDNTSIPNLSISYSYIDEVNRLFGDDSPFKEWEMDEAHLVNAAYQTSFGKLTGYYYGLDFDDNPRTPFPEGVGVGPGITNFDSETWGLRLVGKHKASETFSLLYELEWANQDPTDDAANNLDDNDYYNIEAGGAFSIAGKPVVVKVGHEVLEGNGVNALQTPLATVHAFNGWADKFVGAPGGSATPVGGLEDTSVTASIKGLWGPSKVVLQYHDYSADKTVGGVSDYGTEWSILAAKPFAKNWLALLKYTDFDADSDWKAAGQFDTRKFWAMLQFSFK